MNRIQRWVSWLLWRSKVAYLASHLLARHGRFVLEFHGIGRERYQHIPPKAQPYLSQSELEQVLTWVESRFAFLTPEDFLIGDKPGILLTFDDGFANNATYALPILQKFTAPAVFFVTTQHVQDPKDWLPSSRRLVKLLDDDMKQDLAHEFFDGMSLDLLHTCAQHPLITIGSHTVSHPLLTKCNDAQLLWELIESKQVLFTITEQPISLFAYPSGNYDKRVAEAVQQAGYCAAFVEDSRHLGLGAFEIPRIGVYRSIPPYLAVKLSGLHKLPIKQRFGNVY